MGASMRILNGHVATAGIAIGCIQYPRERYCQLPPLAAGDWKPLKSRGLEAAALRLAVAGLLPRDAVRTLLTLRTAAGGARPSNLEARAVRAMPPSRRDPREARWLSWAM